MSIARPQNRVEFRQYVLTKLGAPVLEVNVSEEQIDIAIEDAFQYFNERSHFLGTEQMFLTTRMTPQFIAAFTSHNVEEVSQIGKNAPTVPIPGRPTESADGMVEELTLVSSGDGYPPNRVPMIYSPCTTLTGSGQNLTVTVGSGRTVDGGLLTAVPNNVGYGYEVGDQVTVDGAPQGTASVFQVTKIKTESPVYGKAAIETQNNYLVLPDNVVGVNGVLQSQAYDMAGIFPGGAVFPVMLGGVLGNDFACGDMGYDLVSYVAMREYLATLEWLFFPPISYGFNERTHKLHINGNKFMRGDGLYGGSSGKYLVLDCMVKPSPDIYPDLWNDLWVKEYCVALTKAQWGRNLTKYNQVQLPGGITMNGAQILQDAQTQVKELKDRFSMDWADPPLDLVG